MAFSFLILRACRSGAARFGKALSVIAALGWMNMASAQSPPQPAKQADDPYTPYFAPGRLAKLEDGRSIHIVCLGRGSPTVVLTAGAGDWSATWRKVQPAIARHTRVCAWDRAGFGLSGGSKAPQNVLNTTSDLEAALRSLRLMGPYVMVGHSIGALESILFKDRHPRAVVGMVLVDPSFPGQSARVAELTPHFNAFGNKYMDQIVAAMRSCAEDIRSGKVTIGSPDPKGCLAHPAEYSLSQSAQLSRLALDPDRWAATVSFWENIAQDTELVVKPSRRYGSMPLTVLTATAPSAIPSGAPEAVKEELPAYRAGWVRGHDELAALSSSGRSQLVADSSHYIQYDRPDLVIAAIDEDVMRANGTR